MDRTRNVALALSIVVMTSGCGGGDSDSRATITRTAASISVAPAADYNELLQRIYVAYFGRPADPKGLAFWANAFKQANVPLDIADLLVAYDKSAAIKALIDNFGISKESQDLYDDGDNAAFVNSVYRNLFNRDAEPAGRDYWAKAISDGVVTKPVAALAIMGGAQALDSDSINRKVIAASQFTTLFIPDELSASYTGNAANSIARRTLNKVTGSTTLTAVGDIVRLAIPEVQQAATLPVYHLTSYTTGSGRGVITPASGAFRMGEEVTVRMQPDFFSDIRGWTQRSICAGKFTSCRATINGDSIAEARFEPAEFVTDLNIDFVASRDLDDGTPCSWHVMWQKAQVRIKTTYTSAGRSNTLRLTGSFNAVPLSSSCTPTSAVVDQTYDLGQISSKFNVTVMAVDGVGDQMLNIGGELPGPLPGTFVGPDGTTFTPSGLIVWQMRYVNARNAKGDSGPLAIGHITRQHSN